MLEQVQQQLAGIYRADPGHDIRDYLVTDRKVALALAGSAMIAGSDETVLVAEDDDGVLLSVFLDSEMLSRLDGADPLSDLKPDQLDDLWQVVEGVSHFNYLACAAQQDRPVTLLELELQAEVDKYVSTLLLSLAQGDSFGSRLHGWLFDAPEYREELDDEQRERYSAASQYASRFCHRLRERLLSGDSAALPELRQFYRFGQREKISHIHTRAWGNA